jgi:glutamate racemase
VIGVLATAGTLRSEQFAELCKRHATALTILGEACPGWVEAVEQASLDGPEIDALVARHIHPLLAKGADTLVLGCTHYAFLRAQIEAIAGPNVSVLEPSEPVARQLRRRLEIDGILSLAQVATPQHRFFTSAAPSLAEPFVRRVWPEIVQIEKFNG